MKKNFSKISHKQLLP